MATAKALLILLASGSLAAGPAMAQLPNPWTTPADAFDHARVEQNYLWEVVAKLRAYRYQADTRAAEATTVLRVVIARDGRLLDVEVVRSSGVPEIDRGVVAGVRQGSPYSPLPPEISGESASFRLPLASVPQR